MTARVHRSTPLVPSIFTPNPVTGTRLAPCRQEEPFAVKNADPLQLIHVLLLLLLALVLNGFFAITWCLFTDDVYALESDDPVT